MRGSRHQGDLRSRQHTAARRECVEGGVGVGEMGATRASKMGAGSTHLGQVRETERRLVGGRHALAPQLLTIDVVLEVQGANVRAGVCRVRGVHHAKLG